MLAVAPAALKSPAAPAHNHPHPHGQAAGTGLPEVPVWRHRGHVPVFDAHLHIPSADGERHWQRHPVTPTVERFVHYLDHCGVERGIINSVRSQLAESPEEMVAGNREVLRWADRYPGRFAPACIIMPQYLEESLREIEDWRRKYGAVWIGELCNYVTGYRYDTAAFTEIMKLATELEMIVQIHARDEEMESLVRHFPRTTMVFPHMGVWEGLKRRVELIGGHPRSYLEISGTGHDTLGAVEYAVSRLGAERVLFGSDFSINDPSAVIAQLDDSRLTQEEKEKVFHRNLESLLRQAGYVLSPR